MTGPAPRRRIDPLPPPPDQFSSVYREATARRYHRAAAACGITGVFLAGLFGGLTLGGGVGEVRQAVVQAALGTSHSSSPSASTQKASTTQSPKVTRATRSSRPASTSASVTAPPEQIAPDFLRGEIRTAAGSPVSGLYVYSGHLSAQGFVPDPRPARTNTAGWYRIACNGGPLLVTSWRLNSSLGPVAEGAYAARFVDTPGCDKTDHHIISTVQPGAVVEGRVRTDTTCPGVEFPLWLWLNGDRSTAVRLSGLHEGDRYRISGAPVGRSVLGARGRPTNVAAVAGGTVQQDVVFACPTAPTTSPDPQPTPDPTPTEPTSTPSTSDPTPSTSTPGTSGSTSTSTSTPPTTGR